MPINYPKLFVYLILSLCERNELSIHIGIISIKVFFFWFMVFNATFNNISVISWRSVLLVEETGVPGENHRPVASHWQTLLHNVVSSTPRLSEIWTHIFRHWLVVTPTTIRSWPRRTHIHKRDHIFQMPIKSNVAFRIL